MKLHHRKDFHKQENVKVELYMQVNYYFPYGSRAKGSPRSGIVIGPFPSADLLKKYIDNKDNFTKVEGANKVRGRIYVVKSTDIISKEMIFLFHTPIRIIDLSHLLKVEAVWYL